MPLHPDIWVNFAINLQTYKDISLIYIQSLESLKLFKYGKFKIKFMTITLPGFTNETRSLKILYLKGFLQHLIKIALKFIVTLNPQLLVWKIIALVGFIMTNSYRVSHTFLFSEILNAEYEEYLSETIKVGLSPSKKIVLFASLKAL